MMKSPTGPVLLNPFTAAEKLKLLLASVLLLGLAMTVTPAFSNEATTQLIEIMRQNGSITERQYQSLKAAETSEADNLATTNVDSISEATDWTSTIKLKGDLRLRFQHGDNDARLNAGGNQVNRERFRARYRLGIITAPLDNLEVGAGLASGGSDPRSTNQTFDNTFSTKGIQLDYAYAQYKVNDNFKLIGGKFKFKNYLWVPTDMIWDGDINPEGVSANFNVDTALGNTFVNGGAWVLNEFSSNSHDPYLFYGQLGQNFSNGDVFGTFAGTYYVYSNAGQPGTFAFSAGTNTDNQFDALNLSGVIGTKVLSGRGKASLIADYVVNTETNTGQDTGYAVGGKLSVDKWSFKYLYADLDANAVPDSFPDSDRFGGATGIKGHEVAAEYAVVKNVAVGLDYYNTESKLTNVNEQILQLDFIVKFP